MPATVSHDGLSIAFESRGDPEYVFVHANGFCKEVWHPVIDALHPVGYVAIDQPGHGDSEAPDPPIDWWDFGRNALAVMDAVAVHRPIGVGHSSGGAALAMAELLRPGTFERLVLIEPIILPPPFGRTEEHPLASGALRRRAGFESAEAALAAFRGRGPFADWTDESLTAYVQFGFRDAGSQCLLKCRPDVEAEVYRGATAHGAWDRLDELGCRVDLIAGANSDSHRQPFLGALADRFGDGHLHVVADAGHFVPMEHPARVADLIRRPNPSDPATGSISDPC